MLSALEHVNKITMVISVSYASGTAAVPSAPVHTTQAPFCLMASVFGLATIPPASIVTTSVSWSRHWITTVIEGQSSEALSLLYITVIKQAMSHKALTAVWQLT